MKIPALCSACILALAAAAAMGGEIFEADAAVRHALANNPEIIAAQAEVAAAEARQRQAALLLQANPQLEGAAGPRHDEKTTADYSISLTQEVEVAGQRGARIEAAKSDLEASRARLAWRRVEVAALVRESFGRALGARRLVEVARDGEKAAEQAMEAADKRFQVGDASRLEINAARVERGRATQERSRAEQRAATALAELQLLLALPPEEPCIVRGELAVAPIDQPETLDALITRAAESRADIVAARFDLESARAESKLADRQWMPSPRFGAAFSHEEGADIVQGLVGVDLPTFNRNQAGRGAASARVLQADQALQAVRRRAEQEVRLADLRLRAAEQVSSAYASEVVSAMRENLDLGNRAYQAGQIDFTQLLLIRRESLEAQRGYVDALEELNSARSELDRAVGREMP